MTVDLNAPCPDCGFQRDTPNHVHGCTPVPVSADAATRERHQIARDARAMFRAMIERAKDEGVIFAYIADATLATIDNADALAAQVEALEAERSVLAAKIATIRGAISTLLPWLDHEATDLRRWSPAEGPATAASTLRRALAATEEGP